MTTLAVATNNAKKLKEIREILASIAPGVSLVTAREIGLGEPEETGHTFRENAIIKAAAAYAITGGVCLADDSGLEVDALGGAPGVHSARFAGPDAKDADNNLKLLDALAGVPPERRTARYRCVIALVLPPAIARRLPADAPLSPLSTPRGEAFVLTVDGACEGRVVDTPAGHGGFGYDPYMLYPPAGLTFAELSAEQKHAVSHRGQALRAVAPHLAAALAAAPSDD